jgi:pre-mRNA-splicing factor ISY1
MSLLDNLRYSNSQKRKKEKMARNEEKAFTLFNKWQTFKQEFHASAGNRRPLLSGNETSLPEAQKVRRELISKITKAISAIKNPELGELRIRETNDEINKFMKQKHYWELKIREMGGNLPVGKQFYEIEGKELPGAPGYRYYGAAKDLPGIKELFTEQGVSLGGEEGVEGGEEGGKEAKKAIKKRRLTRKDLYTNITPEYFGYTQMINKIPNEEGILPQDDHEQQQGVSSLFPSEHLELLAIEKEAEEEFLAEYLEKNPRFVKKSDQEEEDDPLYKELKALESIPEQVTKFIQSNGQSAPSTYQSMPSSFLRSEAQIPTKTTTTALPEVSSIPTSAQATVEMDVEDSKKSLLSKLNLF